MQTLKFPPSLNQPQTDEESEPLSSNSSTYEPINVENKSTSTSLWKKISIGGAILLLAIGLFSTTHHHTPINSSNIDLDNVNLLSKHLDGQDLMSDHGAKAGKKGDGESSKKLTKAEMNTKLFDDQRKFYY